MTNPTRKVQSTVLMASARFPLTLRIFKLTGLPVSFITLLNYLRDVNSFPLIKSCLIPCLFIYLFFHLFFYEDQKSTRVVISFFFFKSKVFRKARTYTGYKRLKSLQSERTGDVLLFVLVKRFIDLAILLHPVASDTTATVNSTRWFLRQ